MQVRGLLLVLLVLLLESRVPSALQVSELLAVLLFLGGQLVVVPLVERCNFISLCNHLVAVASLVGLLLREPSRNLLVNFVAQVRVVLVPSADLLECSPLLLIKMVEMHCLSVGCLSLLLLDLLHEFFDFGLQTLLELFFHLGVLL